MYQELGGYQGYQKTPVKVLQEIRLSMIAELEKQAEDQEEIDRINAEMRRKQEEAERKAERESMRYR
jgi:uncharacterized small protein (DUF1192 family)